MEKDILEYKYIAIQSLVDTVLFIKVDDQPGIKRSLYKMVKAESGFTGDMYVLKENVPGIVKLYEGEGYKPICTNSFIDICIHFNKFFGYEETKRLIEADHA
jgi:hypothetical protein